MHVIDRWRLWGKGLSAIDIHLLGSALLGGHVLWTKDKRLAGEADELAVPLYVSAH
ncbi:MAG: hypothetical protein LBK72_08255 [Bifidobacteriaceae bacterium]|nr:hypothetical protein [Bifidobacteriaceae bacterium]